MLTTTVGQITDKGLKRQANEDNLLALPERGLFLVADGVGGRRGGQIASRTVAEVFERVFNQPQPPSLPESEMEDLRKLVGSTVDLCNQKIFTEAELNAELDRRGRTRCRQDRSRRRGCEQGNRETVRPQIGKKSH